MKQSVRKQVTAMKKALKKAGFNHITAKSNHDGNSAYIKAYYFEDVKEISQGTSWADHATDVRVSTHAPKAGGGYNGRTGEGFGECDINISTVEVNLDSLAESAFKNRGMSGFHFNSAWASYEASV